MRIENSTDEEIVLEPGEQIKVDTDVETAKVLASTKKTYKITNIHENCDGKQE